MKSAKVAHGATVNIGRFKVAKSKRKKTLSELMRERFGSRKTLAKERVTIVPPVKKGKRK